MAAAPLSFRAGEPCGVGRGEFGYRRHEDGRIKWIVFWPRDCGSQILVPIAPQRLSNGHTWTLSGVEEAPTLSPSVNVVGVWHGWLRDGVATQC